MTKSAMFIQPLFDYKPDLWRAMLFGWNQEDPYNGDLMIGFGFTDESYAKEFFGLMRSYNNGQNIDSEDNIKLSFIVEDPENYSVYLYPSSERENVNAFFKDTEQEVGENIQRLIAGITICKFFPYGEGSTFKFFKELYKNGKTVKLEAFLVNLKSGSIKAIEEIEPIIKHNIFIEHRKLLKRDTVEYQHMKNIKKK